MNRSPPSSRRTKFPPVVVTAVHSNVGQEIIEITEDRLHLVLNSYVTRINQNTAWQVPAGILITIVLVFCSAEFKSFAGVPANVWQAIFILLSLSCVFFLGKYILRMDKSVSVKDVVEAAKKGKTL